MVATVRKSRGRAVRIFELDKAGNGEYALV